MTAVEPNPEAEAAWAEHSIGFTWRDEEQRYGEYRAFLAGFGDVAAERKTAAHARKKATKHWNRAAALQARIDAARGALVRVIAIVDDLHKRAELARTNNRGEWWRGFGQGLHDASEDLSAVLADSRLTALTVDEPAPEPPKLDPLPIESDGLGDRIAFGAHRWSGSAWRFNPRPEYSQNEEDYRVQA